MSTVYDRLVKLLTSAFGLETGEVDPQDTFQGLELDSLALVELTLDVQKEFGITISDEDLSADNTVAEAAGIIEGIMQREGVQL